MQLSFSGNLAISTMLFSLLQVLWQVCLSSFELIIFFFVNNEVIRYYAKRNATLKAVLAFCKKILNRHIMLYRHYIGLANVILALAISLPTAKR